MPHPPAPIAPDIASRFMLRKGIMFLNHGSFGAIPREIFDRQTEWRRRIEAEPVEIIARQNDRLVGVAKQAVGAFLGMSPADFGLVTNATEGVNAYLRSLRLRAGDELLATNHVYNAVRQAMRHVASGAGAEYREFPIATPVKSEEDLIRPIEAALGERTRLLVIDHVTSPTALIFPVAKIVALCEKRGTDVLIDGAHAPGMLDLNVPALRAAAYAGNLHKWSCCAKGAGFLWVRPDRQEFVHPCTVSHFRGEGFAREFDWQGTRDLSAWFTIPDALAYMAKLGWERIRRHNHEMAVWAQEMIAKRLGVTPLAPGDGSLIGSMATLPLPGKLPTMTTAEWTAQQQSLYTDDQIEAPLMFWNERYYLRVSCQVYNRPDDYERVAAAIERRIG
jgi:isopenicillin-N epimerase